jgi:hypothetical protein
VKILPIELSSNDEYRNRFGRDFGLSGCGCYAATGAAPVVVGRIDWSSRLQLP